MLTDKDITDIADRCNRATSGPWTSFIEGRDHESGSDFIQTPDGDIELIGGTRDDQDFIAHSRTDIPKLIEEIKRLKTKLSVRRWPAHNIMFVSAWADRLYCSLVFLIWFMFRGTGRSFESPSRHKHQRCGQPADNEQTTP